MCAAEYVRAIHEFPWTTAGDLPLKTDDIIKVTRVVDSNWLAGVCRGKTGNFPCSFVAPVAVPRTGAGERLFAAVGTFSGEETGDLGFVKGK